MLKNDTILQFFFILLTAAVVALLAIKLYPSRFSVEQTANAQTVISMPQVAGEENAYPPERIVIPRISLDLTIAPGVISDNVWTLYDDKVSWLATSQMPGEGNTILYAHNRKGLFAPLKELVKGDLIKIFAASKEYSYRVSEVNTVTPSNINVLLSLKDQLTLYTCDGILDRYRLVVVAKRD